MTVVRAKKNLGQHFLKDKNIALKIVDALRGSAPRQVLEVGPGMGVLTQFLIEKEAYSLSVIELDKDSVDYLQKYFPTLSGNIISGDFLKYDLAAFAHGKISVIGNFPYNISSQIFFKTLDNRSIVDEVVGMIQKEVAERIVALPGNKTYGILSVLLQAFYTIEYLFTVNEQVFIPPPKVKSAVIRLERNKTEKLDCNEKLFFRVVKTGFNQRRKTLRNSLKPLGIDLSSVDPKLLASRPEQLSVADFVELTKQVERC